MRFYLLIVSFGLFLGVKAQNCTELFISEYIEGSSNNKCLELYNPTANAINLSAYTLKFYFNGNTSAGNTIVLNGSIPSKGTYVICDDNAAMTFLSLADQLAAGAFYNGDDAIVLFKGSDTMDIFGKIGMDPGTAWTSGGVTTLDRTLIRDSLVFSGIRYNPALFDPSVEWSQHPFDFADSLGEHIMAPCQSIYLSKTVEFLKPGLQCSTSPPPAKLLYTRTGDSVCYHYQVINTGESYFDLHNLVDDHLGILLNAYPHNLGPGQNFSISFKEQFNTSIINHASWLSTQVANGYTQMSHDSARILATRFDCFGLSADFNILPLEVCSGTASVIPQISGINGTFTYRTIQGGPNLAISPLTGEISPITSDLGVYEIINTVEACGKLIMTGIIDADQFGGLPKAIEFKVLSDIKDLSVYGIGVANNGGGSDGIEYTFPAHTWPAGSFIYLASEPDSFKTFFGFEPHYLFSGLNQNGDDAIELFCHGQVIDVFGDINADGTSTAWEYTDGWVYRQENQTPNNGLFVISEWIYSGPNALDNLSQNSQSLSPFPLSTFHTNFCSFCPDVVSKDTLTIFQIPFDQSNCIGQLNISLGPECSKTLMPLEVILGLNDVCANGFRVDIYKRQNVTLGQTVGVHEIGQTLIYKVSDRIRGQSCWGYLHINSELPLSFSCRDTTIYCTDSLPKFVLEQNACRQTSIAQTGIKWFPYPCDSVNLSGYFVRSFILTDIYQNSKTCTQRIFVRRENLINIICPPDVIIDCRNPLLNAFIFSEFDGEGYAHPKPFIIQNINIGLVEPPRIADRYVTENIKNCELLALYDDVVMPGCGATYTIKRRWTVKNWCTQDIATCEHLIRIIDTSGPLIDTLKTIDTIFIGIQPHICFAEVKVTAPFIKSDCSPIDQIKINFYLSYLDTKGKTIVRDGQLDYAEEVALQLPTGIHPIFFTLTDPCWNTTYDTTWVVVYDSLKPQPVCARSIVLTTNQCSAKLMAQDLDRSSFDQCCDQVHLAVASMDSVKYWTRYWQHYFIGCLGQENYNRHLPEIEELIQEWLNCFVFKDYLEIKACVQDTAILRVFEACNTIPYDEHIFKGSAHQWYMYQLSDRYACWYTWTFNANLYLNTPGPELLCDYNDAAIFDWDVPYTLYPLRKNCAAEDTETPVYNLGLPNLFAGTFENKACVENNTLYQQWRLRLSDAEISILNLLKTKRFHFTHQSNDCMVEVLVRSKDIPECIPARDTVLFADGVPTNFYHGIFNQGISTQYAECLVSESSSIPSAHKSLDCLNQDKLSLYSESALSLPVFCQSWLDLDTFDGGGISREIDFNQLFSVTISNGCFAKSLDSTDTGGLNECGSGSITRSWYITDDCGNSSSCHQQIVIKPRSDFEVCFPADTTISCTDLGLNAQPSLTVPVIQDDDVELMGMSFEDKIYSLSPEGNLRTGYKILRTWKIIDWCVYNPDQTITRPEVILDSTKLAGAERKCVYRSLKDNGDGYLEYRQVIKVEDLNRPRVNCIQDLKVCAEECKANIGGLLIGLGEDECTTPSELNYWYQISSLDLEGIKFSGVGNYIQQDLPLGSYAGYLFCKDKMGQIGSCSLGLTVVDCKAPTPYCLSDMVTIIPKEGRVVIWAKDFNAGSTDDCTPEDLLRFSFDQAGMEEVLELSCADIKSESLSLHVWVHDQYHNRDFCQINLIIRPSEESPCFKVGQNNGEKDKVDFSIHRLPTEARFSNKSPRLIVHQNMPNPFSGQTDILFYVPNTGEVEFTITGVYGNRVMSSLTQATWGWHKLNVRSLAAKGLFYYQIKQGNYSVVKRMIAL